MPSLRRRCQLKCDIAFFRHTDQARAVYDNALEVFSGDNAALDMIRSAGERAGVAG